MGRDVMTPRVRLLRDKSEREKVFQENHFALKKFIQYFLGKPRSSSGNQSWGLVCLTLFVVRTEPVAARVFYISLVFSTVRRVSS